MAIKDLDIILRCRELLNYMALFGCLVIFNPSAAQDTNTNDNEAAVGPVGEVTLVIGRAFLSSGNLDAERLRIGDFIREGDLVRTESNGHVHIRFVDEAVLSVRPRSELQVLAYRFDQEKPENSLVKLNLIEGTARTVSGEAAKTARDRFRFNTPIAAIGVRGTDFVVSATSNSLKALVNDGAIVVAPFSTLCLEGGIGPCNFNGVELDGSSMQILEFDAEMAQPRLVPFLAAGRDAGQYEEIVGALTAASQALDNDSVDLANVSSDEDDYDSTFREVITESVTSVDLEDSAKNKAPYGTGFTPEFQYSPSQLRQRQLVWGRFAEGNGNLERLTLPLSEAMEGRNVSIGANFEYFLFRPEQDEAQVQRGLGEIGFSLTSAQAYFKEGDSVSPVVVSKGGLMMDFNNNAFETSLDLYHMQLGEAQFNATGKIFHGGYFYLRNDQSSIVGAVTLDGQESGYFFDFLKWQGVIQGITLWDSKQ